MTDSAPSLTVAASNPFARCRRSREVPDRLPPHASEAERGILSCCMTEPALMDQLVPSIGQAGDPFYDLRHRRIWTTMVELVLSSGTFDLLTLIESLKAHRHLEAVGGMTYLQQIADASPSSANWSYYLEILMERAGARAVLSVMTSAIQKIYEEPVPWRELADRLEHDVSLACRAHRREAKSCRTIQDHVQDGINQLEESLKGPSGVLSGYHDLDRITMGWRAKQLVIVAGRPSTGKSALLLNIARHLIWNGNAPIGYLSMEMAGAELVNRIAGSWACVDLRDCENWSQLDYLKFQEGLGVVARSNLLIDDTTSHDILTVRARAREMKRQHGIHVLMVDYLQLIRGVRYSDRVQEVGEVAMGLKQLAGELDIPVLAGCSMNRVLDRESPGSRPKLNHLRDSGDIEAHADTVMALYRQARTQDEVDREDRDCVVKTGLDIMKQRAGRLGVVNMVLQRRHVRFEQSSRVET